MSEPMGMEMTRIHHPCKGQRRKNVNVAGRGNKGINVPMWECVCERGVGVSMVSMVSVLVR